MPTITDTENQILRRYAADVAAVAEEEPAADLATFVEQLITASERLNDADISGGTTRTSPRPCWPTPSTPVRSSVPSS